MGNSGIEPFYFGTAEKRLFGMYQPAEQMRAASCGVVLCYPMGREYLLAHRSFRQLANRLSESGFPVLRFDFYSCGDSCGRSEEGSLSQWIADISSAIAEMRRRSGARRVSLIGLRLGGTLAAAAGVLRRDIDTLVLWNAVIQGTAYLQDMQSLHHSVLKHLRTQNASHGEEETGMLGFRLTSSMRAQLENLDLLASAKKPAAKILIIQSDTPQDGKAIADHFSANGASVVSRFVPFAPVWSEGLYRSHVPAPVLASIVSWISEVNA